MTAEAESQQQSEERDEKYGIARNDVTQLCQEEPLSGMIVEQVFLSGWNRVETEKEHIIGGSRNHRQSDIRENATHDSESEQYDIEGDSPPETALILVTSSGKQRMSRNMPMDMLPWKQRNGERRYRIDSNLDVPALQQRDEKKRKGNNHVMDEIAPPELLSQKRVQKSGITSVHLIDENEQRENQRSDKQLHLTDYQ